MAQRTVVQLVDDIDGTQISNGEGETVAFALDGAAYEIDVTNEHAKQLRDALSLYIANGRRVGGGRGRAASTATVPAQRRGSTTRDYDPKALRVWAQSNKIDVPARGRIPQAVVAKYKAAGY